MARVIFERISRRLTDLAGLGVELQCNGQALSSASGSGDSAASVLAQKNFQFINAIHELLTDFYDLNVIFQRQMEDQQNINKLTSGELSITDSVQAGSRPHATQPRVLDEASEEDVWATPKDDSRYSRDYDPERTVDNTLIDSTSDIRTIDNVIANDSVSITALRDVESNRGTIDSADLVRETPGVFPDAMSSGSTPSQDINRNLYAAETAIDNFNSVSETSMEMLVNNPFLKTSLKKSRKRVIDSLPNDQRRVTRSSLINISSKNILDDLHTDRGDIEAASCSISPLFRKQPEIGHKLHVPQPSPSELKNLSPSKLAFEDAFKAYISADKSDSFQGTFENHIFASKDSCVKVVSTSSKGTRQRSNDKKNQESNIVANETQDDISTEETSLSRVERNSRSVSEKDTNKMRRQKIRRDNIEIARRVTRNSEAALRNLLKDTEMVLIDDSLSKEISNKAAAKNDKLCEPCDTSVESPDSDTPKKDLVNPYHKGSIQFLKDNLPQLSTSVVPTIVVGAESNTVSTEDPSRSLANDSVREDVSMKTSMYRSRRRKLVDSLCSDNERLTGSKRFKPSSDNHDIAAVDHNTAQESGKSPVSKISTSTGRSKEKKAPSTSRSIPTEEKSLKSPTVDEVESSGKRVVNGNDVGDVNNVASLVSSNVKKAESPFFADGWRTVCEKISAEKKSYSGSKKKEPSENKELTIDASKKKSSCTPSKPAVSSKSSAVHEHSNKVLRKRNEKGLVVGNSLSDELPIVEMSVEVNSNISAVDNQPCTTKSSKIASAKKGNSNGSIFKECPIADISASAAAVSTAEASLGKNHKKKISSEGRNSSKIPPERQNSSENFSKGRNSSQNFSKDRNWFRISLEGRNSSKVSSEGRTSKKSSKEVNSSINTVEPIELSKTPTIGTRDKANLSVDTSMNTSIKTSPKKTNKEKVSHPVISCKRLVLDNSAAAPVDIGCLVSDSNKSEGVMLSDSSTENVVQSKEKPKTLFESSEKPTIDGAHTLIADSRRRQVTVKTPTLSIKKMDLSKDGSKIKRSSKVDISQPRIQLEKVESTKRSANGSCKSGLTDQASVSALTSKKGTNENTSKISHKKDVVDPVSSEGRHVVETLEAARVNIDTMDGNENQTSTKSAALNQVESTKKTVTEDILASSDANIQIKNSSVNTNKSSPECPKSLQSSSEELTPSATPTIDSANGEHVADGSLSRISNENSTRNHVMDGDKSPTHSGSQKSSDPVLIGDTLDGTQSLQKRKFIFNDGEVETSPSSMPNGEVTLDPVEVGKITSVIDGKLDSTRKSAENLSKILETQGQGSIQNKPVEESVEIPTEEDDEEICADVLPEYESCDDDDDDNANDIFAASDEDDYVSFSDNEGESCVTWEHRYSKNRCNHYHPHSSINGSAAEEEAEIDCPRDGICSRSVPYSPSPSKHMRTSNSFESEQVVGNKVPLSIAEIQIVTSEQKKSDGVKSSSNMKKSTKDKQKSKLPPPIVNVVKGTEQAVTFSAPLEEKTDKTSEEKLKSPKTTGMRTLCLRVYDIQELYILFEIMRDFVQNNHAVLLKIPINDTLRRTVMVLCKICNLNFKISKSVIVVVKHGLVPPITVTHMETAIRKFEQELYKSPKRLRFN